VLSLQLHGTAGPASGTIVLGAIELSIAWPVRMLLKLVCEIFLGWIHFVLKFALEEISSLCGGQLDKSDPKTKV
jgi:hypothetical protein